MMWYRRGALGALFAACACGGEVVGLQETATTVSFGYDRQGYDRQGYDRQGFDLGGFCSGPADIAFSLPGFDRADAFVESSLSRGRLEVLHSRPASVSSGWRSLGIGLCRPGDNVTLTGAGCAGREAVSQVRVCADLATCSTLTAIGYWQDRRCASYPVNVNLSFSCPSSGHYNVSSTPGRLELDASRGMFPVWNRATGTDLDSCPTTDVETNAVRACGWRVRTYAQCTPGALVRYCSASCTNDPMMRICAGNDICTHEESLDWDLDSGIGACPCDTFECPESGSFIALIANQHSTYSTLNPATHSSWQVLLPPPSTPVVAAINGTELSGTVTAIDGTTSHARLIIESSAAELPGWVVDRRHAGVTRRYRVSWADADRDGVDEAAGDRVSLCGEDARDFDGDGVIDFPELNPAWSGRADHYRGGIFLAGWWDSTGARRDVNTRFTLSCGAGALTKCYRWGYQPWGSTQLSDAHLACVRMARADYCGDGASWTMPGTDIGFYDFLEGFDALGVADHRQDDANIPPSFAFEAGWDPGGSVCLSHQRWDRIHALRPNGSSYPGVPPWMLCPTGRLYDPMFADASGCIRTPEDPNNCIRPSVCDNDQDVELHFGTSTKLFQRSALTHTCDPEDPASCAVPPPDPGTCLEESP